MLKMPDTGKDHRHIVPVAKNQWNLYPGLIRPVEYSSYPCLIGNSTESAKGKKHLKP